MKMYSSISVVVQDVCAASFGSNCARQGINIFFTAMCVPLSFIQNGEERGML